MRGMGRRGSSSNRGSLDQLMHSSSSTDQGIHSTHDKRDDSLPSTTRHIPAHVTSSPITVSRQLPSPICHLFGGSSSSSVSTPCANGGASPDGDSTTTASGNPTSAMDGLAITTGMGKLHIQLRLRLDRDPLPYEFFKVTHTKKGTCDLIDVRAQAIKVNK
ncbi:hypothetical protein J5N97_025555 [Dioscorea zingiberensis]|uniref:Uncharacterized protein n=1 Tax=Dioscorea zingiberensis TaxID=325984 RepID=A0A9D5C977_9LILI|nr:hypothetical protein J5N97_025555 [Dioscorea zingiberensis]